MKTTKSFDERKNEILAELPEGASVTCFEGNQCITFDNTGLKPIHKGSLTYDKFFDFKQVYITDNQITYFKHTSDFPDYELMHHRCCTIVQRENEETYEMTARVSTYPDREGDRCAVAIHDIDDADYGAISFDFPPVDIPEDILRGLCLSVAMQTLNLQKAESEFNPWNYAKSGKLREYVDETLESLINRDIKAEPKAITEGMTL